MQPAKKLFELGDITRCPLTITQEAQDFLNASHHQARILPQALQEHFGAIAGVAGIEIAIAPMSLHHPFHEDTEGFVLIVTVKHVEGDGKEQQFHLNASMMRQHHAETLMPTVQARHAAQELHRLYRHKDV